MQKIVHPLLTLLASTDQQELVAQIRLLKAENQILRSKLPKRIALSNQERQLIVKHGKPLGGKVKDVLSIVSYSTFRRWVRKMEDSTPAAKKKSDKTKSGRPKTEESIRDCIIRIRMETDWGYTKILQAMRRLGHRISRQTVKNILVEAAIDRHRARSTERRSGQLVRVSQATCRNAVAMRFCVQKKMDSSRPG